MAKLYFNFGTMESAKSAMLLIEAHNFEKRNIGFLCMKPSIDNRESIDKISSRIGAEKEVDAVFLYSDSIMEKLRQMQQL